jgi:hypothetical protein
MPVGLGIAKGTVEVRMHGHVNGVMGQGFPADASQVAAEKAASLQRAAAVRRRLLREAAELGGVLEGDAADLVEAWAGHGRKREWMMVHGSAARGTAVSYYV